MLEQIRKMMAEVLQISSADVNKTREELLAEQATEDARYAATSALNHPEGSTTPIEEAYSRAQDRVARIRKQVEKELPKVMSLIMAMEVAEQRRAEAKLHREQGWSRPASEKDLNLNRAAVDWFPRLRQHGVYPDYLRRHSNETVAIISDLIIWKAKDATFQDPTNPWRQVLGIYACRKINKPGRKGRKGGSVPGMPQPDRHNIGSGDYRFDEMVSAAWDVVIHDVEAVEVVTTLQPAQAVDDQMINIEEGAFAETENPADGIDSELDEEAAGGEISTNRTLADFADATGGDEYGLPKSVTDEAAATLRSAAVQFIDTDFGYWREELDVAISCAPRDMSEDDLIATVGAWKQPEGVTPFYHFVEAARRDGREAGIAAYREATIRRTMLMIATEPDFADARKRLGLQ